MRAQDAEARGFPPFPATRSRRGGATARTWWGRAWNSAVEQAALDADQLRAGRTYARSGRVGSIAVSPGRISASVDDTDGLLRVTVSVRTLTDAEWNRFAAEAAARTGHVAALLDHDIPRDLHQAAEDGGVRLLPRDDEFDFTCDCPGWEHPCRHAAALCHQFAWLLDSDPLLLLLLRGRTGHALADELRRVRLPSEAAEPSDAAHTHEGEDAARAWRRPAPPLPEPFPPPGGTGTPPALPDTEELDAAAVRQLAADAAHRAAALLRGARPADLDAWQDTVRLAASCPEERLRRRLARASGRVEGFDRAVRAWQYGGADGLETLEQPWTPPAAVTARARAALRAAWEELGEARVWRNRWTLPERGVQLRYGRDGRWHPYLLVEGEWWPAAPGSADPGAALSALLAGEL
ncbi:SWIM zinc finger family protein [Thermobifida cellulosilytica]|uniref:SWIM-type domain-containing protein n=1 Tax=Thermobifida cellulosilytica TB100 TaxID=665004 RepID=A0A147KJP3_THECS|nr:hypothetical protein [Thermobifida cellulosilytica]KUP97507.1 hypothetical protein AC529_06655 [Thermobifida cellulosilytica TB100]